MARYRNAEGYSDCTAGLAIQRVNREEMKARKNNMAKRNCRLTTDEKKIHEKAVKMRKMTDAQLVSYVENRVAKSESEGYNRGKKAGMKQAAPDDNYSVRKFIEKISELPGVGAATMKKIKSLENEMEGAKV